MRVMTCLDLNRRIADLSGHAVAVGAARGVRELLAINVDGTHHLKCAGGRQEVAPGHADWHPE
jgi:hypothetical protein